MQRFNCLNCSLFTILIQFLGFLSHPIIWMDVWIPVSKNLIDDLKTLHSGFIFFISFPMLILLIILADNNVFHFFLGETFFILLSYGESLTVIFLPTEDKEKEKSKVFLYTVCVDWVIRKAVGVSECNIAIIEGKKSDCRPTWGEYLDCIHKVQS